MTTTRSRHAALAREVQELESPDPESTRITVTFRIDLAIAKARQPDPLHLPADREEDALREDITRYLSGAYSDPGDASRVAEMAGGATFEGYLDAAIDAEWERRKLLGLFGKAHREAAARYILPARRERMREEHNAALSVARAAVRYQRNALNVSSMRHIQLSFACEESGRGDNASRLVGGSITRINRKGIPRYAGLFVIDHTRREEL